MLLSGLFAAQLSHARNHLPGYDKKPLGRLYIR